MKSKDEAPLLSGCACLMGGSAKRRVDTRILVETPEGVDFEFVIAGPGKRCVACFADLLIRIAITGVCLFLWLMLFMFSASAFDFGIAVWLTIWFVTGWFYNSFFETVWNGQTPGKRLQNLRVVRANGTPISAAAALGRNFLRVADSQPAWFVGLYTAGLISMLCTRRLQRLGDVAFDTMVIDEGRDRIRRPIFLTDGVEALSSSECTRRYHVPERTLAIIERLFEGDRIVSEGRREQIAMLLSRALQERLGYQEPPVEYHRLPTLSTAPALKHTLFLKRVLKTFSEDFHSPRELGGSRSG